MIAKEFKFGSINNCGILYLTGLAGVKQDRVTSFEDGTYVCKTAKQALLDAICSLGWTKTPRPTDLADIHAAAIAWTDADAFGNGEALAQFFMKEGYVVSITDIGHNTRYGETPEEAAGHQLRHYIVLLNKKNGPGAGKYSLVKEYRYVFDDQTPAGSPVPEHDVRVEPEIRVEQKQRVSEPRVGTSQRRPSLGTGLPQLRATPGRGVRSSGAGGPLRTFLRRMAAR